MFWHEGRLDLTVLWEIISSAISTGTEFILSLSSARFNAEKWQGRLLSPLLSNLMQSWSELAGGGYPHQRCTSSSPPQDTQGLSVCRGSQGQVSSALPSGDCAFTASPSLNLLALDKSFYAERSGLSQFKLETKYLNPKRMQGWGGNRSLKWLLSCKYMKLYKIFTGQQISR